MRSFLRTSAGSSGATAVVVAAVEVVGVEADVGVVGAVPAAAERAVA